MTSSFYSLRIRRSRTRPGYAPTAKTSTSCRPPGNRLTRPNALRPHVRQRYRGGVLQQRGGDRSRTKRVIAFNSNRPTDPTRPLERVPQIYVMNPDGTGQRLLVNLPRGAAFPNFAHNGNHLCFQTQIVTPSTGPRRDIYTVRVDGHGPANLTSEAVPGQLGTAGDNLRCDWSPKDDVIAFTSNRHDPYAPAHAQNQEILCHQRRRGGRAGAADVSVGFRRQPGLVAKGRQDRLRKQPQRPTRDLGDERGRLGPVSADAFRQLHAAQNPVD